MTANRFRFSLSLIITTLSINSAQALPIDWTGVFGVDTHMISNYRRTKDKFTAPKKPGTQAILSGDSDASFQTYIFKLNPNIIVNDGVTLKGEFSSGYLRGGFAGGDSTNTQDGTAGNSYFHQSPAQRSGLNVNQLYMELYADTALIKAGRFAKGFGTGMIFDAGTDPWDRFFTMYDGVEAEMKIGNFSLIPHWAKISSYDDDGEQGGRAGDRPAGGWDVREMGVTAKYDNKNRDLVVAVLYGKRFSERKNSHYNTGTNPAPASTATERGKTDVTVIEPFVSKKWNKLTVAAEGSLQTGEYGTVYTSPAPAVESKLAGTAYLLDAKYDLNPKWDMGIIAGQVSGDDGDSDKFEGIYLNPNFHVAELMFRYNYSSFNEGSRSIFDSSITNARFVKLYGNYKSDKWTWKGGLIFANALETAKQGDTRGWHQEEGYSYGPVEEDQKDDYGYELDFGFDYRWNPNVVIGAYYGYWFVGDYYEFDNSLTTDISVSNVHGGGLRATLEF